MIHGAHNGYHDVMPDLDLLTGPVLKEIAKTTKGGLAFLKSQNRLNTGRRVEYADRDPDLLDADPEELLGKGTTAEVYKIRIKNKDRRGLAVRGYVRKGCLFGPTTEDLAVAEAEADYDGVSFLPEESLDRMKSFERLEKAKKVATWRKRLNIQSGARSLWVPFDKKLEDHVSPLAGFYQQQPWELWIFQEMLPFTQDATIKGIGEILRQDWRQSIAQGVDQHKGNALVSLAYLFRDTAELAAGVNLAGYVDRDGLKPANVGVAIVNKERGLQYLLRCIDNGEFIPSGALAASMTPQYRDALTFSESMTVPIAPSRMIKSIIGEAPESAIKETPHDQVVNLGYVIATTINPNIYANVRRDRPFFELKTMPEQREIYREHMRDPSKYPLLDPALGIYHEILAKALDEERVVRGDYTIQQMYGDLKAAAGQVLADVAPLSSEGDVHLYLPTKRLSQVEMDGPTTATKRE
jgi:hypothetical protein